MPVFFRTIAIAALAAALLMPEGAALAALGQPSPWQIGLQESGAISGKTAKDVFQQMFKTGRDPKHLIEEQGLGQIDAGDEVAAAADAAIVGNPKAVQDYRGGKEEAIKFLVGHVMKETRGRARPEDVTSILKEKLNKGP